MGLFKRRIVLSRLNSCKTYLYRADERGSVTWVGRPLGYSECGRNITFKFLRSDIVEGRKNIKCGEIGRFHLLSCHKGWIEKKVDFYGIPELLPLGEDDEIDGTAKLEIRRRV